MEDLSAVVYPSTAKRSLSARDLDAVLISARSFNEPQHVTGVLLHQGSFLQYFEGPEDSVNRVYERIRHATKPRSLVELVNQRIAQREFTNWHMAFAEAPATGLEDLATEYWEMTVPGLAERAQRSPGLELLLDYWKTARSDS